MKTSYAAFVFISLALLPISLEAADYTIVTLGGQVIITDTVGISDTLIVTEPAPGQIRFAAPGRTFAVDGGTVTNGNSGDVPLTGVTELTINAESGDDTISIGAFSAPMPALTINGGAGNDNVEFTGNVDFAGAGLNVDLQNDAAVPGSDRVSVASAAMVRGVGLASHLIIRCSRDVSLASGALLQTTGGNIIVEANQQAVSTPGDFSGVSLNGAFIRAVKSSAVKAGNITVKGRGGNAPAGEQMGVRLLNAQIFGGLGVYVEGLGGASVGPSNCGINAVASFIQSGDGLSTDLELRVTGVAGANGTGSSVGVAVLDGASIRAYSSAPLHQNPKPMVVSGTGAGALGGTLNHGIELRGADSQIIASQLDLQLAGTAGAGAPTGTDGSWGLLLAAGTQIKTFLGGNMSLVTDSLSLNGSALLATTGVNHNNSPGSMDIQTATPSAVLDLGGSDELSPRTLGISNDELQHIQASHLLMGSPGQLMKVSASISPIAESVSFAGILSPSSSAVLGIPGTSVMGAAGLQLNIAGLALGTDYVPLTVAGSGVAVIGGELRLNSMLPGAVGDSFTLVHNLTGAPVSFSFRTLPDDFLIPGAGIIRWPGSSTLAGLINYDSGPNHDVVLTLVAIPSDLKLVTNTNDTGIGSLRAALLYAATQPGTQSIGLAANLSGKLIQTSGDMVMSNITLDASGLPAGIAIGSRSDVILDSNHVTFTANGVCQFKAVKLKHANSTVAVDATVSLTDCATEDSLVINQGTLTASGCRIEVGSTASNGVAISNSGSLTLSGCSFGANPDGPVVTSFAGTLAIMDCELSGFVGVPPPIFSYRDTLTITRCAFTNNSVIGERMVSPHHATMNISHCTFVGNTGGAIDCSTTSTTISHSTFTGNSALLGGAILGSPTMTHCTLVGNTLEEGGLGSAIYGGFLGEPTLTHCLIANNSVTPDSPTQIITILDAPFTNNGSLITNNPHIVLPLADNGGPTPTMALPPSSPARNAALGSTATSDQRGCPIIGVPDIGAYEAGTFNGYTTWISESLPATATAEQRATTFDYDSDGHSNQDEWLALTSPADPANHFGVSSTTVNGDVITTSFPTALGRLYQVEYSTNLTTWLPVGDELAGTGSTAAIPITRSSNRCFTRVKVRLP